jgi:CheY-like chemotaxis protein
LEGGAGKKKILVVASDESLRHFCHEALRRAGYGVELASDIHSALLSLKSSLYDLVISDIEVPALDGIDLYISILKKHPYLKNRFIFIAGDSSADLSSFLKFVQIGYILKPVRVTELLSAVGRVSSIPEPCLRSGFLENRREGRFTWGSNCVAVDGALSGPFSAILADISRYGMRIRFRDGSLIPQTEVSVEIDTETLRFRRDARVAWLKGAGWGGYEAGLKFSEPFPVSSVIMLAQGAAPVSN